MPSKKTISLIKSLSRASIRKREQLFIAEGYKTISDLIPYFTCSKLIVDEKAYKDIEYTIGNKIYQFIDKSNIEIVDSKFDFNKISNFKTPQKALAILECKKKEPNQEKNICGISLFLDDIQDPGNMGTIIRTADWFNIDTIFTTKGCVDIYSPKVVQATMGSLARVNISEINDINLFFKNISCPIFGTFLEGENIYNINKMNEPIVIVMGNEGNGISNEVSEYVNRPITIPMFHKSIDSTPDSLNVAIATAITISHFRSLQL